jgi:hypothetical protein
VVPESNIQSALFPKVEDFTQTSTSIVDLVHVTSKHPTYDFQVGDLVALVSRSRSVLASLDEVKEDSLSMTYYHHGPQISGKRLVWLKRQLQQV